MACPSCQSNRYIDLGKIPQINTFAGNKLNVPIHSNLFKCKNCNLYFKYPRLTKKERNELYKNGAPENWNYEFRNRRDWQIAFNWINKKIVKGSILDIGCWDGKFLERFKENWKLYGIEINQIASHRALSKGVSIVTKDISKMNDLSIKFDITTAFDFIEHVEYPLDFLASMLSVTKNYGYIIVSSGNTEAPSWKIGGSRYWYCSSPEHISFINMAWCCSAANKLNLQIEYVNKFSKAIRSNPAQIALDLIKNITYLFAPSYYEKIRIIKHYYFNNKENINNSYNHPPTWFTSNDHLIVIFKKINE